MSIVRKHVTWVLVADGQRARILQNDGPGKGLAPVPPGEIGHANPPTREQGADRPGRTQESVGGARHAMEPRADWHRAEKARFAAELAGRLERAARDDAFERLILIAPPQPLGDLRKALPESVRARVAAEIDKDLTHAADAEVARHLAAVLAV